MEATKESRLHSKIGKLKDECKKLLKNVTVEPLVVLFNVPAILTALAGQNLYFHKACHLTLRYSEDICNNLGRRNTTGDLKDKDTEIASAYMTITEWSQFFLSGLPFFIILFLGSWSDRSGRRKLCILLPLLGQMMSNVTLLVCTHWMTEFSMELTNLSAAFWLGLGGNWFVMYMGTFSYLADVSAPENLTARIGIVTTTIYASIIVGKAIAGFLIDQCGLFGVFLISMSCSVIGLGYGVFFLGESSKAKSPGNLQLKDFFSVSHIIGTFRVFLKKTTNHRREKLAVLVMICIVVSGPTNIEQIFMYPSLRHRFQLDHNIYSNFAMFSAIVHVIGTAFMVGIFKYRYRVDDAVIGIISTSGKIAGSVVYSFAVSLCQIYLAPVAEITQGASTMAFYGIIMKLVPSAELGQVNSVFGLFETLTPIVYNAIYTNVFNATKDTWPGAYFLVGGVTTVAALLGFVYLYIVRDGKDSEGSFAMSATVAAESIADQKINTA